MKSNGFVCTETLKTTSTLHSRCFQMRGYFKGMSYPLWSAGALNSLFFGVYGVTLAAFAEARIPPKDRPKDWNVHAVKPTNWEIYWAGCAGGVAQLVVACPVDLVKIKLQTQTGRNSG